MVPLRWNIRNSTEYYRASKGKLNGKKSERETNHERLWTLGNELIVMERRWVAWGDDTTG